MSLLFLFPSVALLDELGAASLKRITLVCEEWPNYTNADGSGLYWDIVREIFAGNGIALELRTMPWKRAQHEVKIQRADALVGEYYHPRHRDYLYPKWHLSLEEPPVALYLAGSIHLSTNQRQALKGKRVAWVRGYDYDHHFLQGIPLQKHLISTVEQGVKMLLEGHIDVLIDYRSQITPILHALDPDHLIHVDISQIASGARLFVVFSRNQRGQYFKTLFDSGMTQLRRSGGLARLYAKWRIPFHDHALTATVP